MPAIDRWAALTESAVEGAGASSPHAATNSTATHIISRKTTR
jgi:hypothetical protein